MTRSRRIAIGLELTNITCSSLKLQDSDVPHPPFTFCRYSSHHCIPSNLDLCPHHTSNLSHAPHHTMSPLSVPKIFMAGGAVGFGYYLYMRQYWFPNPYKTQGIENIENRFSSGGGHPTHAPAQASQRGTANENQRLPLP